jgi:hypothetical protein
MGSSFNRSVAVGRTERETRCAILGALAWYVQVMQCGELHAQLLFLEMMRLSSN